MTSFLFRALILTLALAGLLATVHHLTEDRIAQGKAAFEERQLASLLPSSGYDPPLKRAPTGLPIQGRVAPVYLAYLDGAPASALIELVTPKGYSGEIKLMLAVSFAGEVLGVRAMAHRETPGLGDAIDYDKSPWITQFNGRTLTNHSGTTWAPDRRGGDFDTITSATITSSAVIESVELGLRAYVAHRDSLWGEFNE